MAYGTVNVDSVVNSDGVTSGGLYGFKNRIINGAMTIDQRNAGASVTLGSGATYTLDRWRLYAGAASKASAQQNAGSVTPPAGYKNYLGVTSLSAYSISSSDQFLIDQFIKGYNVADLGWGAAGASPITLSFWVRSSLTGTFGGALNNSSNDRSYPFSYTISAANTWEQKSITIAGDTTGTWLTTNGRGISLRFGFGVGSTYSGTANAWVAGEILSVTGATSVVGTSGATFYITGVQLEKGSTATSFDYRPYPTELALCQRYFISYGGTAAYERMATCVNNASNNSIAMFTFPVEMRSAPTFGYSAVGNFGIYNGSVVTAVTGFSGDSASVKVCTVGVGVSTGLTTTATCQFLANNTTSARATWSAEL